MTTPIPNAIKCSCNQHDASDNRMRFVAISRRRTPSHAKACVATTHIDAQVKVHPKDPDTFAALDSDDKPSLDA